MTYPFPHDLAKLVHEQMATGCYGSEDDMLRDALKALDERRHGVVEEDDAVIAGVRRGLADMKAGRHQSLAEFDAEFRAKHNLVDNG